MLRSKEFVVEDLVHLGKFAQRELQKLWGTYSDHGGTSTIYHFCWDRYDSRYRAFAFRSTGGFASEELGYGIGTKPGVPNAKLVAYPDSFIEVMVKQRESQSAKSLEDRVFIGGEIQLACMEKGGPLSISTVHRFPDYSDMYADMCKHLASNSEQSGT